jgi:hypothetical protein
LLNRTDIGGGVKLVQSLGSSQEINGAMNVSYYKMKNYLAIVGTGENVMHPKHKIVLWDVQREQGVSEINFKSEVLSISGAGDQM